MCQLIGSSIGSVNGLSSGWCQAINWTNYIIADEVAMVLNYDDEIGYFWPGEGTGSRHGGTDRLLPMIIVTCLLIAWYRITILYAYLMLMIHTAQATRTIYGHACMDGSSDIIHTHTTHTHTRLKGPQAAKVNSELGMCQASSTLRKPPFHWNVGCS